jgi:PAS domain S-box-containing protein
MKSSSFPPKAIQEAMAALSALARIGAGLDVGGAVDGDKGPTTAQTSLSSTSADGADRRLQLAEARYRGLIEQIPAVTFLARLSGGRNEMYVSPQIQSLLGFSQEEWLNDPVLWYRQTHPEDRDRVSRTFAASCFSGKPFHEVFRVLTKTKETIWVDAAAKLVRDTQGGLLFLQGVGFDVTEQFRAVEAREQLLREQSARAQADRDRARLRDIFTNLPAAMWLLEGSDYRVEIMNPAAQRLFDVGPEKLGRPFDEVFPDLALLVTAELDQALAANKPIRRSDLRLLSAGWEKERYFDVVYQPSRDDRGTHVLVHAIETTEQVEAKRKIEEALRLREEFIAIAAHELRTPITSVLGQSQLALRRIQRQGKPDPRPVTQSLEVIIRQARRLSDLITQLLDISRLETGKLAIDRQRTDLVPLVDEVVSTARMLGEKHPITSHMPPFLEADVDSLRLEQVLTNLVQNAIKYSPEGGAIEVVLRQPDPNLVELSVRDHGLGIAPEKRAQIFERFYQAHDRHGQVGLGLGLYISREIVRMHRGEIHAEFPEDGGTRFIVVLPREAPVPSS